eukprot:1271936-Rhodomonas_salina.1
MARERSANRRRALAAAGARGPVSGSLVWTAEDRIRHAAKDDLVGYPPETAEQIHDREESLHIWEEERVAEAARLRRNLLWRNTQRTPTLADHPSQLPCKLVGCDSLVFVDHDSGQVHDFCGKTHAEEFERALEGGTVPSSETADLQQCNYPDCQRPMFMECGTGELKDFCGRNHAWAFERVFGHSFKGPIPVTADEPSPSPPQGLAPPPDTAASGLRGLGSGYYAFRRPRRPSRMTVSAPPSWRDVGAASAPAGGNNATQSDGQATTSEVVADTESDWETAGGVDGGADWSSIEEDWRKEILKEECGRRGIEVLHLPALWERALAWATEQIQDCCKSQICSGCRLVSKHYVSCSRCAVSTCKACLGVAKESIWGLAHVCAGCVVDSLDWYKGPEEDKEDMQVEDMSSAECELAALADNLICSQGAALASATWSGYQRCVQELMQFSRTYKHCIFPVLTEGHMWGLSLFFQHLRKRGLSWAAMAKYWAAIRSLLLASGAPDPWERFPQLRTMCEGLKKQVGTPASRKEGVTINIFKAVFEFWETSE